MGKKKSSCLGQLFKVTLWICFWPFLVPVYIIKAMIKKPQNSISKQSSNVSQPSPVSRPSSTSGMGSAINVPKDIILTSLDHGTLSELAEPTERQIAYMKDLRVFIPDGITKTDASCIISRVTGEDSEEGPAPWLVAMADQFNISYSAYIGFEGMLKCIINQVDSFNLAALYGYSVHCNLKGNDFRNFFDSSNTRMYYEFANIVESDSKLKQSLLQRSASDFLHPNKNTNIYKAAKEFFIK